MNLSPATIKDAIMTWYQNMAFMRDLKAKHEGEYDKRLSDWDQYG